MDGESGPSRGVVFYAFCGYNLSSEKVKPLEEI